MCSIWCYLFKKDEAWCFLFLLIGRFSEQKENEMSEKIEKQTRIDVADVLRGLAVMGIVLLHSIEHFNFNSYPDPATQSAWLNFADKAIWDGLFFLLGGKAYAVFALLFGFSFFIQENNQSRRGKDFRWRFCWRLILLFVLGNMNAMFFTAEVLVLYSLVGFILPLTCRMKDRSLFILACFLLIQPLGLYHILRAWADSSYTPPVIPTESLWKITYEAQSQGTFLEMLRVNLWEGQLASLAWAWDNARFFQTGALFLFGVLIGRRQLFCEQSMPFWGKVLAGSLIAFFPLYGLGNMLPEFVSHKPLLTSLLLVIQSLSKFSFMLILVSGVLFAFYKTKLHPGMMKLAPYGKMSLTNYIMQSMIGSFVFYHWGLGLDKELGVAASFLVGGLLFVVQLAFCRWWMRHHAHGLLEVVWKWATWLK